MLLVFPGFRFLIPDFKQLFAKNQKLTNFAALPVLDDAHVAELVDAPG